MSCQRRRVPLLHSFAVPCLDLITAQDEAVAEVIKLIAEYPPDTRFFLNA